MTNKTLKIKEYPRMENASRRSSRRKENNFNVTLGLKLNQSAICNLHPPMTSLSFSRCEHRTRTSKRCTIKAIGYDISHMCTIDANHIRNCFPPPMPLGLNSALANKNLVILLLYCSTQYTFNRQHTIRKYLLNLILYSLFFFDCFT